MRELAALSGVSKKIHELCRPIIFRDIDLSIHNRGVVKCTYQKPGGYPRTACYESSDSLQCNDIPSNMQMRQSAFLSALIRDPSLAQHVKSFSWTLLLLDSNRRPSMDINPFAIYQKVALGPKSPFNQIWGVFASLTNVQTLNLAWLTRDLATPLIHSIPRTLFPAATTVCLAA